MRKHIFMFIFISLNIAKALLVSDSWPQNRNQFLHSAEAIPRLLPIPAEIMYLDELYPILRPKRM